MNDIETTLSQYVGKDFKDMTAKEFSDMILGEFNERGFEIHREVVVKNRGDGHAGRIDAVLERNGKEVAFEFDKCSPRVKSVYKLMHLPSHFRKFCILRSPFNWFEF